MAKKIDKIDLKTPDAFHTTSDKIFVWIEEHAKTVVSVVGVIVALSLIYIAVNFVSQRREARAAETIYQAEGALKKAEASVREAREKENTRVPGPGDKKKAPVAPAAPKTFEQNFGTLVSNVEAKISEIKTTRVGLVAAMNLAYFLIQEKQAARALTVLDLPTARPRSSDVLAGFYAMHRGLALLETSKFKEAAEQYQGVLAEKSLDALHPEALLKLGVARELAGDVDAARESYEKVGRDFPGTEASTSAQNFLRALALKAKKG